VVLVREVFSGFASDGGQEKGRAGGCLTCFFLFDTHPSLVRAYNGGSHVYTSSRRFAVCHRAFVFWSAMHQLSVGGWHGRRDRGGLAGGGDGGVDGSFAWAADLKETFVSCFFW